MSFDASRARLQRPDMFARFNVGSGEVRLQTLGGNERLLVFERNRTRRALLTRQMAYHHVAQGELAHAPYLVTF